jgi:hypothetical protein
MSTQPAAKAKAKTKTKGAPDDESWALELLGEKGRAEIYENDEAHELKNAIPVDKSPESNWNAGNNTKIRLDDELSDLLNESDFDAELSGLGAMGSTQGEAESVHLISATADESWAQSILSELEQDDKKQEHKDKKYGMEVIRDDIPAKAPPKNVLLAAAMGEKVDPEQLKAARDAQSATRAAPAPAKAATTSAPRPAPKDDALAFDNEEDALSFLNEDLDLGTAPPPATATTATGNTFSLAQPLSHVDAPVELASPRDPIAWGRLIAWGIGCTIAVACLIVQYVYFNFDRLAADEHFRPVLESSCQKLGCYVPDVPDATKLRIDELTVRPNAQVNGALQVDALVRNTAAFLQPFPAIKLSFTDKNDQLVAARIFQPREYLRGDATHLRRIPPDTPIHISLAVVNPGTQAVNYSMEPLF